MEKRAGLQIFNARGSCVLDSRCGLTRIIEIRHNFWTHKTDWAKLKKGGVSVDFPIENPNHNNIWVRVESEGSDFIPVSVCAGRVKIWENRQGFTITFKYYEGTEEPFIISNIPVVLGCTFIIYGFY